MILRIKFLKFSPASRLSISCVHKPGAGWLLTIYIYKCAHYIQIVENFRVVFDVFNNQFSNAIVCFHPGPSLHSGVLVTSQFAYQKL